MTHFLTESLVYFEVHLMINMRRVSFGYEKNVVYSVRLSVHYSGVSEVMFYLVNIAVVAIRLDEGRFSNHIKIFSKNLNILKDNLETF